MSQFGTLQSQEKKLISNEHASTVSKKQNRQKDSGTISKNQSPLCPESRRHKKDSEQNILSEPAIASKKAATITLTTGVAPNSARGRGLETSN